MHLANQTQLTYCTNIHGGENWEITFSELKKYVIPVKKEVCPDQAFGLGLRLSHSASEELNQGDHLNDFKKWLVANDLYIVTINGFPYGNFHKERVKENVHNPDWSTEKRLHYTKNLAEQLAFLLPEGASSGISTAPISYKYWHKTDSAKRKIMQESAKNYVKTALFLQKLEQETGHHIHLDIEPEPDGLLENTTEVISYYKEYLIPQAEKVVKNGDNPAKIVKKYLQICYDICHFSLAYEEPEETFSRLKEEDIAIGKIQISAALKVIFDGKNNKKIWQSLARFNEPTYLHQVTVKQDNKVITYPDLPEILTKKDDFRELRAHFHVPIFLKEFQGLLSTQNNIIKTLDYLKEHRITQDLEVETYTWEVLPQALKIDLSSSIIRELHWVLDHIK